MRTGVERKREISTRRYESRVPPQRRSMDWESVSPEPEPQQDVATNVDDVLGLNLNDGKAAELPPQRQRRPRYLQEEHLLTIRGVPYIRKHAQTRVRKAIQHKDEYKNLTNLLSFYQIWGHNLFPKAKLGDFVEMCATVGQKGRRLKELRRKYVDEDNGATSGIDWKESLLATSKIPDTGITEFSAIPDEPLRSFTPDNDNDNEEDFERAFLARAAAVTQRPEATTESQAPQGDEFDDEFDDDDDELFTQIGKAAPAKELEVDPNMEEFETDAYEAELEAMREYGL